MHAFLGGIQRAILKNKMLDGTHGNASQQRRFHRRDKVKIERERS